MQYVRSFLWQVLAQFHSSRALVYKSALFSAVLLLPIEAALADVIVIDLQKTPPPPGSMPGSCWGYGAGVVPANFAQYGM
jgi:hypothetical protein